MSDEVPNFRGGIPETVKWIVGLLVAAGAFFGGLVWQAARYPDRPEFNELRNQTIQMKLDTSHRLDVIEGKIDQLSGQQRLEDKVDALIQQKKGHDR